MGIRTTTLTSGRVPAPPMGVDHHQVSLVPRLQSQETVSTRGASRDLTHLRAPRWNTATVTSRTPVAFAQQVSKAMTVNFPMQFAGVKPMATSAASLVTTVSALV